MHEMMVAQSLMAIISDEAAKHNAKPVGAKISCGTLNPVNDEALRFAFEAIAKETSCEGLEFQIEHKPLRGRCRNCGHNFDVELSHPVCSECGGEDFALLPDAPLMLEEIDFQTD
ncbi:MAG: hydrogenase maturation nickel metallochaperone HypA [Planctomycetes bacterium B3_Pla]|nr:MAG: hydrogenase maturation nickel metallochaperone HypA [Planctomycetes bacterium B3_Pla]